MHPKVCGVLHLFIDMRRLQKQLGRDAPAQSTSPTKAFVLFYQRHFQPELRRANRRHITTGAGANDRYIKLFVSQSFLLPFVDRETEPKNAGSYLLIRLEFTERRDYTAWESFSQSHRFSISTR